HAEALAAADQADATKPGTATVDLIRAASLNATDRPADALAAVDRYEREVGPEGPSCLQRGEALLALARPADAAAAFRAGLDDSPQSADNLWGLFRAAGPASAPEVRDRLAAMRDPATALRAIGNLSLKRRRTDLLAAAVDLADGLDPGPAAAMGVATEYFRAELHIVRHEWPQAVAVFERHADRLATDPFSRASFPTEYGVSLMMAGRVLDGYRHQPDKAAAFAQGADRLAAAGDAATLDALIALHAADDGAGQDAARAKYRAVAADLRRRAAQAGPATTPAAKQAAVPAAKPAANRLTAPGTGGQVRRGVPPPPLLPPGTGRRGEAPEGEGERLRVNVGPVCRVPQLGVIRSRSIAPATPGHRLGSSPNTVEPGVVPRQGSDVVA
ncbi:MAG: hypothetical protein JWO31_3403, partial [Phycisphaerales bacterium]|nr:hypothetical protein [Phycisphaerales bacterium]